MHRTYRLSLGLLGVQLGHAILGVGLRVLTYFVVTTVLHLQSTCASLKNVDSLRRNPQPRVVEFPLPPEAGLRL